MSSHDNKKQQSRNRHPKLNSIITIKNYQLTQMSPHFKWKPNTSLCKKNRKKEKKSTPSWPKGPINHVTTKKPTNPLV